MSIFRHFGTLFVSIFAFRLCYGAKQKNLVIHSFRPGGQYILLTFDDGPDPILTPKLLDILKEKKIHVTFFVLGQKVKKYPRIVSRMVDEGHEVGIHGWNHAVLSKLDSEQIDAQLQKTSRVIFNATNQSVAIMRPSYGKITPKLSAEINTKYNLKIILWSVDSGDWKKLEPKSIIDNIVPTAKPGDVILCHDIEPSTVEALPSIIDGLEKQSFEFLTVSQMLSFPDDSPHRMLRESAY